MTEDKQSRSPIRYLAELGLQVNDLQRMVTFYRDVVGLEVFSEETDLVFLKVAEAVEGHPQLLALFDRGAEVNPATSTLDHFAFLIDVKDYEEQRRSFEDRGVKLAIREFPSFHWRSFFLTDPEGNRVEFVAYDPSVTG